MMQPSTSMKNIKAKQFKIDAMNRLVKRNKQHDAIAKTKKESSIGKGKDLIRKLSRNKSLRHTSKTKTDNNKTMMMHRSKSHLGHEALCDADNATSFDQYRLTRSRTQSKIALNEIPQNLVEFDKFLVNEENIEVFSEFLKLQFCQENINFWLECEQFKTLFNRAVPTKQLIRSRALKIFKQYLGFEAKQPVNVNYECLQAVEKCLSSPTENLFDEAQLEVFNLMRTDCYPRFCKQYKKRNQQLNNFTETISCDATKQPQNETNDGDEPIEMSTDDQDPPTSSTLQDNKATNDNSNPCIQERNYIISSMRDSYPVACSYKKISTITNNNYQIQRAFVKNVPQLVTSLPPSATSANKEPISGKSMKSDVVLPTKLRRRTPPPPPLPPRKKKPDKSNHVALMKQRHVAYVSEKIQHSHSKCKHRLSTKEVTSGAINQAGLKTEPVFVSQPVDV